MLAPPPEGTFDLVDGHLPVKSPSKESSQALRDNSPEQVPLLAQEPVATDHTAQKKDKVRIIWHKFAEVFNVFLCFTSYYCRLRLLIS